MNFDCEQVKVSNTYLLTLKNQVAIKNWIKDCVFNNYFYTHAMQKIAI